MSDLYIYHSKQGLVWEIRDHGSHFSEKRIHKVNWRSVLAILGKPIVPRTPFYIANWPESRKTIGLTYMWKTPLRRRQAFSLPKGK